MAAKEGGENGMETGGGDLHSRPTGKSPGRGLPLLIPILAAYFLVELSIVVTSVTPAPDARRYLAFAQRLESEPWLEVLRSSEDHPGYPLLLRGAFFVASDFGATSPWARIRVGQCLSVLAGAFFVVAAHRALRQLFSGWTADTALLAFVFLPRPAWLGAELLTDMLHGALWIGAFALFVRGIEKRRLIDFLGAGVCAALAYLVRVDALTLPALFGTTLCILAIRPRWREGWSTGRWLAAAALLFSSLALVIASFVAIYGRISPKPVTQALFQLPLTSAAVSPGFIGAGALATISADESTTILQALWDGLTQLAQQVQFVHLLMAAAAIPLALRAAGGRSTRLVAVAALFIYWVLLAAVEIRAGYVTGRYFLPVIPLVVGFSAFGVEWVARRWHQRRGIPEQRALRRCRLLVLGVSLLFSLPSLLGRRLHQDALGTMRAGRWIALHAEADATLHDPYFLPSYAADLRSRTTPSVIPKSREKPHYVIAEDRQLDSMPRLKEWIESGRAREVASFCRSPRSRAPDVRVYRLAPDP